MALGLYAGISPVLLRSSEKVPLKATVILWTRPREGRSPSAARVRSFPPAQESHTEFSRSGETCCILFCRSFSIFMWIVKTERAHVAWGCLVLVTCPACDKKLKVNDDVAGKKIRCPGCKEAFAVPEEQIQ